MNISEHLVLAREGVVLQSRSARAANHGVILLEGSIAGFECGEVVFGASFFAVVA